MKKTVICLLCATLFLQSSFSQEKDNSIPVDVFYLLPEFAPGYVVFQGRTPVDAILNICAVDGTVRFKDEKGEELAVTDDGTLTRVNIDGVDYLRKDKGFARIYPVNDYVSLAAQRSVNILTDTKTGAYGMQSNTESIRDIDRINVDGSMYKLESVKNYPYRTRVNTFLYFNGAFLPITKKNVQKCFPDKSAEIEILFKENKKGLASNDIETLLALIAPLAQ